jgi:hypothetical protein
MGQSEWFTLNEIAHLRGLSYIYVKNLASLHKWRKSHTKPQRYHILDVIATFTSDKD